MKYQTVYDTESGLWGMRGTSKYGPTGPEYTFWNIHDFKNEIFYSIDPQSNFCVNNTNSPDQGNCLSSEYFLLRRYSKTSYCFLFFCRNGNIRKFNRV